MEVVGRKSVAHLAARLVQHLAQRHGNQLQVRGQDLFFDGKAASKVVRVVKK